MFLLVYNRKRHFYILDNKLYFFLKIDKIQPFYPVLLLTPLTFTNKIVLRSARMRLVRFDAVLTDLKSN